MTAPTPPAPGAPASGEPSGQASQGTQPPAVPAAPPAPQQPGQAPATQPQGDKTDLSTLPADVRKIVEDARAEAARHRTEKQTAAQQAQAAQLQRDAILKALGLTPDGKDAPPDADALAAQVTQLQAVAWENGAQAAIVRVAGAAGADADALLDSNTFLNSLEGFVSDDPNSAEFRTKMQAHIKAWVEKNPKHRTATGPARTGGDMPPGSPGNVASRPKSLMDAVSKAFKPTT
jgi:hypothetical protein